MANNYLITGATGFVGSHMIDFLLSNDPKCQIYASRRWRSLDDNIKHLYGNKRVKFIEADLIDRGSLRQLIKEASPITAVWHFAAQSLPQTSFYTPISTLMTNAIGTANFLDELKEARDLGICDPIIISVSSSEVYGMPEKSELPIKETNSIRAANPYSISKVTHDLISQYYYNAYGLKIIVTRMFSHEGKRRGKKFALSSFAYQIAKHEKEYSSLPFLADGYYKINVGNLNSLRTYSHIDDAVNAYWLCYKKGKVGEVYNIGGKDTLTVGDALEKLLYRSLIPRNKFIINVDKNLIRPTDITLQVPDCTKFKKDTGWEPIKGINNIIDDLLQYWRSIV